MDDILMTCLAAAVPMWAATAAEWSPGRVARETEEAADIVAAGADILFRGTTEPTGGERLLPTPAGITRDQMDAGVKCRDYRPGEIFNALAKGLGIGSLVPGGVTWMGCHWCAEPHRGCPDTKRDAA